MDSQLSEDQFMFIKLMCGTGVHIILAPTLLPTDPPEVKNNHDRALRELNALVDKGFVTNITERFKEPLRQAFEKGWRTFNAFELTELAVQMFKPPEGSVN